MWENHKIIVLGQNKKSTCWFEVWMRTVYIGYMAVRSLWYLITWGSEWYFVTSVHRIYCGCSKVAVVYGLLQTVIPLWKSIESIASKPVILLVNPPLCSNMTWSYSKNIRQNLRYVLVPMMEEIWLFSASMCQNQPFPLVVNNDFLPFTPILAYFHKWNVKIISE